MQVRSAICMGGTHMHTPKIHLCVDGRYAINHYPGIGRVTSALCAEWATNPAIHRLDIIINRRSTHTRYTLPVGPHIHLHDIDAPPFSIAEWMRIRHRMHQLRPDWIYAPYFNMPPHVTPSKRMLTIHDAIPLEVGSMSRVRQHILRKIVRNRMEAADCVTTVSAHAAQQIRRHYQYNGAISVIPNGVSEVFWHNPGTNTRHSYGVTRPFALCVSSNQPHKNIHALLAAWHIARETARIPADSQLVIAGHVDPRREMPWLQPPYTEFAIMHIADPSDALLNELYHTAHLFVLPSLAEGFGVPIIEALAAGCVVLCHDYPTLRQLHGDVVQYTAMNNPSIIAQALGRLWQNDELRQQHKLHAQAHARTFSWAQIAHKYVDVMQKNAPTPR